MGITLTSQQLDELFDKNERHQPAIVSFDRLETTYSMPPELGSGCNRQIRLAEGICLDIFDVNLQQLTIERPEQQHLVQFMVHLAGVIRSNDFLYGDPHRSYIGGSGIQRAMTSFQPAMPEIGINVHFEPQVFQELFALPNGELPIELQPLIADRDWQQIFSTKTTDRMKSIVRAIFNCPMEGAIKRFYLQGKVFELVALQLNQLVTRDLSSLKPDTIERIHQAAQILRSQLEHPPDRVTLAKLVGVSDRTLGRGFQQIFGMTVLNYSIEQRMHRAKQLLSTESMSVAQVASLVGYAHLGRFAGAFQHHFGTTPHQLIAAKDK